MKEPWYVYLGEIIGIVGGIAGILVLWDSYPALAGASVSLILAGLLWYVYRHYHRGFRELRRGLSTIQQKLLQENFHPDVLIAFNRSGNAIASMLAVNLGIQEILAICRRRKESPGTMPPGHVEYEVGSLLSLDVNKLRGKKLLVVCMLIDTGRTLQDGLAYLSKNGIEADIRVATIYISLGAKNQWPKALYVFETSEVRQMLDRLPWVLEHYHYV